MTPTFHGKEIDVKYVQEIDVQCIIIHNRHYKPPRKRNMTWRIEKYNVCTIGTISPICKNYDKCT